MEIIGQTAGKYQILERVGQGGMSAIYRALDKREGTTVAVKVLSAAMASDPDFKARFAREIDVLRTLKHRRILPILDYGDIDGLAYIVMPYFPHGTLRESIESGISLKDGAKIIDQVSEGLDYAHAQGIIHRDVKPSNILLTRRNRAVLSDFGFAHLSSSSLSLTGSSLIGTPAYMSPELIRGEDITGNSDQYSLAVVIYEMVTGRTPFQADSPMVLVFKHLNDPIPSPREFNLAVPEEVEDVLLRALRKDPKRRYSSVADLNKAFQKAVEAQSSAVYARALSPQGLGMGIIRSFRRASRSINRFIQSPKVRKRARIGGMLSLVLLVPAAAWAAFGMARGSNASAPGPTEIMATVNAVQTDMAFGEGSALGAGDMQTAVAATVSALMDLQGGGGSDGSVEPTASATPTATLTPTPTPSNTPQIWFYPTVTRRPPSTATPTPTEVPSLHVSRLEGKEPPKGYAHDWEAEVKIWVMANDGSMVEGATVSGTWTVEGSEVQYSCETKGGGDCKIKNKHITSAGSTTFTVTNITFAGYVYAPGDNVITSITISYPTPTPTPDP